VIARSGALALLAIIHVACTRTLVFGADPYADCTDLGDLVLSAYSRADAEARMKAQVLELGGDTLLFGERGRSGRTAVVPEEIVERRNELVIAIEADGTEAPSDELAQDQVPAPAGELWYYGAALRCNE
jgi:hypothetical protein